MVEGREHVRQGANNSRRDGGAGQIGSAPQDVRDALTITANLVGRLTTGSVSRPRDLLLALQTYAKLAELADFEERLERLEQVHALQREDRVLDEDDDDSEG